MAIPTPRLDYIVNDEKVKPGDVLLTSGDDRIFPKGLLIGTVTDAKPALPFQLIHVQPAARLDRLEDVLVLLSQQELEPRKTGDASFPLIPEPANPDPAAGASAAASGAAPAASPAATATSASTSSPSGTAPASPKAGASSPKPSTPAAANPPRLSPRRRDNRMASMLSAGAHNESNVEVHKYYGGTVIGAAFLALLFQVFLHKYGRWAELVDLPLLVTIYFGVSKRNPVSGMFLGAVIGILQDALGHDNPIGLLRNCQNHHRLPVFFGRRENRHRASRQPLRPGLHPVPST